MTAIAAPARPAVGHIRPATAGAMAFAAALCASLAGLLWLSWLDRQAGIETVSTAESIVNALAILIGTAVGATIAARFPRNPVGWLVLAALSMFIATGALQTYGELTLIGGRSWPGGGVAAAIDQSLWLLIFGVIGAMLLLYPTGRPPAGRRWHVIARASLVIYPAAFVCGVFAAHRTLDPPLGAVRNPLAIGVLDSPVTSVLNAALILSCLALLVLSTLSVRARYRQAEPLQRAQLKWMLVAAAVPPTTVLACFAAGVVSPTLRDTAAAYGVDMILIAVPLATALAMTRYRLYSVDRFVDSALVYLALTTLLTVLYVVAVIATSGLVGARGDRPPAVVALATLAAAAVAAPLRRRLQQTVARRLHRRRYDAVRVVDDYVRRLRDEEAPLTDLAPTFARALSDPTLELGLWQSATASYVGMDGAPLATTPVGRSAFHVMRGSAPVAVVVHDPSLDYEPLLLDDVTRAAALPLDNGRLHVEVLARLEEVNASRQRIVMATYEERRRLERDLHDGAQQRLVSLALSLRLARDRVDGASAKVLDDAATQLTAAVREVRALAQGIHPAALTEDGLAAALESMADRTPIPVVVDVPDQAFAEDVAAAAYFTACEAVTNAVKHAHATAIDIRGSVTDGELVLEISDDGDGEASLRPGGGLQGLADRLDALGGQLTLSRRAGGGTTVRAEVPCGR
jgi:signal transduction histidine kinase